MIARRAGSLRGRPRCVPVLATSYYWTQRTAGCGCGAEQL